MTGLTSLTDESFTHKDKSEFDLYISFDDHTVTLTVWEPVEKKIIAFEPSALEHSPEIDFTSALKETLSKSFLHEFYKEYHHVVVVSGIRNSTLVPNSLFDNNSMADQQHFLHKENKDEVICVDSLRIADARTIYSLPSPLYNYFIGTYHNLQLIHTSSTTIENQLSTFHNDKNNVITLLIHSNYFELIASNEKSLLLYNSFEIENTNSVIYYTLFCCEQLKLDPEILSVQLGGKVGKTSAIYLTMQNYFKNLHFANAPENITLSYLFSEKPSHALYQFYCIPSCV